MPLAPPVTRAAPTATDQQLVLAVRSGDDRAFEELFSRYRGRISAYALGMVGDHARAEDITQDVFISALRRLRGTERPIAFKPWLYEIAKNACIDEFRRKRRRHEVPLDPDGETVPGELELPAGGLAPDTAIENRQQIDRLRGAFYGLSRDHHRILLMRELEGRSYVEIGERMEMTPSMVESTLFRARRRLGEEYQDLESGRRCHDVRAAIDRVLERPAARVGIRQRRQIAMHVAHCELCRRYARASGLDESYFKAQSLAEKIAALLPIPWLLPRRKGPDDNDTGAPRAPSALAARGMQAAGKLAEPLASSAGSGRAAAALLAALALTTAGGGVLALNIHSGHAKAVGGTRAAGHATVASHRAGRRQDLHPGAPGTGVVLGSSRRAGGSGAPASGGARSGGGSASPGGGLRTAPSSGLARTVSGATSTAGKLLSGGSRVTRTVNGTLSGAGKTLSGVSQKVPNVGKTLPGTVQGVGNAAGGVVNGVGNVAPGVVHGVTGVTKSVPNPGPVVPGVGGAVSHVTHGAGGLGGAASQVGKVAPTVAAAASQVAQSTLGVGRAVSAVLQGAARPGNAPAPGVSGAANTASKTAAGAVGTASAASGVSRAASRVTGAASAVTQRASTATNAVGSKASATSTAQPAHPSQ
jgi:RNA polymerase sigma factor (sigma-70 family)